MALGSSLYRPTIIMDLADLADLKGLCAITMLAQSPFKNHLQTRGQLAGWLAWPAPSRFADLLSLRPLRRSHSTLYTLLITLPACPPAEARSLC